MAVHRKAKTGSAEMAYLWLTFPPLKVVLQASTISCLHRTHAWHAQQWSGCYSDEFPPGSHGRAASGSGVCPDKARSGLALGRALRPSFRKRRRALGPLRFLGPGCLWRGGRSASSLAFWAAAAGGGFLWTIVPRRVEIRLGVKPKLHVPAAGPAGGFP